MTIRYLWAKGVTSAGPFAPTSGYKWKLLYGYVGVTVTSTLTTADSINVMRKLNLMPTGNTTEYYVSIKSGLSPGTYFGDMGTSPDSNSTSGYHIQINQFPVISDQESLIFTVSIASGDTFSYWIVVEETKA